MANNQLRKLFSETNLNRKKFSEYQKMTKKEILKSLKSMCMNYDKLRKAYCKVCLERDYLKRKMRIAQTKTDTERKREQIIGKHRCSII